MNTYIAEIEWLSAARRIVVTEAEGGPLIGMALLEGCRITVDVAEGGPVTVQALQSLV